MNNDFYVYIYWRLDINEPFYIGKGHGDRWRQINTYHRNKHFINIKNKHRIMCEIIKDNLTEDEAFYWEEFIIALLVFEYGFSIEVKGCNSDNHYCHLVNQTWGGDGTSGMNPYENKTEEEMAIIGEKKRSCKLGDKNPMWNKSPRDFMSEENWKIKIEKVSGKNNYKANNMKKREKERLKK